MAECKAMLKLIALLCAVSFMKESLAALNIIQGRVITTDQANVEAFPIIGIATVEIDDQITYYFDCITDLTSNNGSGIRWTKYRTNSRLNTDPIPDGSPGRRLTLNRIMASDLGVYTCWDRHSSDNTSVNITDSNPAIMAAQKEVGVVQGSSAVLEVYISGYPMPHTADQIRWHRPEGYIVTESDEGVEFREGRRILVLSDLQPQQAGMYMCEVALSHQHRASACIQLDIYVPPTFLTHPQAVLDALEWSSVTLTCSASGTPPPLISWEREGEAQLPVGAALYSTISGNINATSRLRLTMVRYANRGRYRCVADNDKTNVTLSDYANITISPKLRFGDDQGWLNSDIYFVEDQSRVGVECFGTGDLQWNSSSGLDISSNQSSDIHWSYDHTRDALALMIKNFTTSYTAVYTCTSDLAVLGSDSLSLSLLITSSNPAVFIQSSVQYVIPGNSTAIKATVHASPADSILVQWYHDATLINTLNETGYTTSQDGSILEIESVGEDELGEYMIVVSVDGVNASDEITLEFKADINTSSTSVSSGPVDSSEAIISTTLLQTESTTSSSSKPSTVSDSHSPHTLRIPRIAVIVLGLFSGILLICMVEVVLCCVYKIYVRHVRK